MAGPLQKIAFLLEDFQVPSPGQQLLDRFLIGYPRDGEFHRSKNLQVSAWLPSPGNPANFGRRAQDFSLRLATSAEDALREADGVVVAPRGAGVKASDELIRLALEKAPSGASVFIHGALGNTLEGARLHMKQAASRHIALVVGTPTAVTWRLPEIDLPLGTPLREALIVVQGRPLEAELHALEGLLPVLERRRGGEAGVRGIRRLEGTAVWMAGDRGDWSWPLLAAAISRSDTPQGDAVKDGRTQDLVGMGLVPRLAAHPRAWLIEHRDGLRTTVLVLDGVVADFNFAVKTSDGREFSAQLYRPPPPGEQHFSRLAEVIENFFRGLPPPWPLERSLLIAGLVETFGGSAAIRGEPPNVSTSPAMRRLLSN